MKSTFSVLLAGVGAGLLIVWRKFGAIDPCGILRAEIRQEAAREGGFAIVASVLPDSVIDAIIAAQYGPLSPARCIALVVSGPPPQAPAAPHRVLPQAPQPVQPQAGQHGRLTVPQNAASLKQAGDEAKAAMIECKNKRLSGQLKTYMASTDCSNPRMIAAFQNAGYRYMDLIYRWTAKRRALAEKIDKGTLTEAQAEVEGAQFMVQVHDEERQRDTRQR